MAITLQQVKAAVEDLESEGAKPTIRAIQGLIGGGKSTIMNLRKQAITLQQVKTAIETLESQGLNPTILAIQGQIGSGSTVLITKLRKQALALTQNHIPGHDPETLRGAKAEAETLKEGLKVCEALGIPKARYETVGSTLECLYLLKQEVLTARHEAQENLARGPGLHLEKGQYSLVKSLF